MTDLRLKERGFSLIQLVIAMVLLGTLSVIGIRITTMGSQATSTLVSLTQINQRTARLVERLGNELRSVGASTLVPSSPFGEPAILYQRVEDIDGGDVVWGDQRRLECRPDPNDPVDGIDNNGDGFTDEHILVLVVNAGSEDETEVSLATDVAPYFDRETLDGTDENDNAIIDELGISFQLRGSILTFRCTLLGLDPHGEVFEKSVETSVALRN